MEGGLLRKKKVLVMVHVLLMWHLRTAVTSIQGKATVSARTSWFEKEFCGLHSLQGFTQSHLSLSEEARNTELHHSWDSGSNLRHSRIAFISAGTSSADDLNPVIQKSDKNVEVSESFVPEENTAPTTANENQVMTYAVVPDEQMSNMTLNDLEPPPAPLLKSEEKLGSMSNRSSVESGLENTRENNELFFTDLRRADEPMHTGLTRPKMKRSLSLTSFDSSEEIVLFAGRRPSRNKGGQKQRSSARSRKLNGQAIQDISVPSGYRSFSATVVDDPVEIETERIQHSTKKTAPNFSPRDLKRAPFYLNGDLEATADRPGRRRRGGHLRKDMKYEEILNDYAANISDSGGLEAFVTSSRLNKRDLGGSENPEWQDEAESFAKAHVERGPLMNFEDWDSTDLEDFNGLSTSNDAPDGIEHVLSKRERPSGVQYLVVGSGYTIDDARWFPVSSLGTPSAEALVREFEENAESNRLIYGSDVYDTSVATDEQVTQDLQDDLDNQEDDKDLEERRKARMSDEQIAKLLSKQEELGLGSTSLMLFDGDNVGKETEEELQPDELWEQKHRAPSRSQRKKRSQSRLPSATTFADIFDQDPYNGFDVLDQQRLSLRRKPKGWREKLPVELSDSELEQSIQMAWEKDRTKKKMRKQERQELRAQGLLGKKNKVDLKAKYSEGISMIEVKKEIKDFLLSSLERCVASSLLFNLRLLPENSLPLPPMGHEQRKMVHEIANVFKLKSKSIGGGKFRFPVLYKTSRTMQYNKETLKAVESVLASGRFLPRMDRAKMKSALISRGRRGGVASAGVSYRDGEVVGAAAPEIGQENRGRTMLERMGWSTGTALGALNNNRGLVQPVAQVVKTSRSGLG